MSIPNNWPDFWSDRHFPGILADFIKNGDLVFDIGANIGKMTWMYRRLGARVVAIEPQAVCVEQLKETFMDDDGVTIEAIACGERSGAAKMSCYGGTTISTLVPGHYWQLGGPWEGTPTDWTEIVPMTTLDLVISQYGIPAFIKIDVEGYEHQVLCGLSQFVPLQFEYHPVFWEQACKCMARILQIEPAAQFCNVKGESLIPDGDWCGYNEMSGRIRALFDRYGKDYFGNIYARKGDLCFQ
jgi:FkbM family methyltransferase